MKSSKMTAVALGLLAASVAQQASAA